jgi:hypothetical protein
VEETQSRSLEIVGTTATTTTTRRRRYDERHYYFYYISNGSGRKEYRDSYY